MTKKVFDFLSSFGMVILGVSLLFIFTVSFSSSDKNRSYQFPRSHPRVAGGDIYTEPPMAQPQIPLAKDAGVAPVTTTAFSAFVEDEQTGTVLYQKNSDEVRPLASITKIMAMMVFLDLPIKWSATTTVLESDCDNSSHQLTAGEIYTLADLWNAALVGSSNSAVRALARSSGLTEEYFVGRMNQKAKDLNLSTLHFVEPTGLDSDNVGSAKDTAQMLKEALKFEKISQALQIGEYYLHPLNSAKPKRVWSTNWLLTKWIPNDFDTKDICGKTGFINDARYNFVVRVGDKTGHRVIAVVMGAATNEARFSEARDLANWAFEHYLWPDETGYESLAE